MNIDKHTRSSRNTFKTWPSVEAPATWYSRKMHPARASTLQLYAAIRAAIINSIVGSTWFNCSVRPYSSSSTVEFHMDLACSQLWLHITTTLICGNPYGPVTSVSCNLMNWSIQCSSREPHCWRPSLESSWHPSQHSSEMHTANTRTESKAKVVTKTGHAWCLPSNCVGLDWVAAPKGSILLSLPDWNKDSQFREIISANVQENSHQHKTKQVANLFSMLVFDHNILYLENHFNHARSVVDKLHRDMLLINFQ